MLGFDRISILHLFASGGSTSILPMHIEAKRAGKAIAKRLKLATYNWPFFAGFIAYTIFGFSF